MPLPALMVAMLFTHVSKSEIPMSRHSGSAVNPEVKLTGVAIFGAGVGYYLLERDVMPPLLATVICAQGVWWPKSNAPISPNSANQ